MTSKLLRCTFPQPDATVRLICFPWAGGGANFYANWGKLAPSTVEVVSLCFPGRETRFKEPPHTTVAALLREIVAVLKTECADKPFAFWGHSLGALISYETALLLKRQHKLEPVRMFVSGVSAPHSEKRKANKTRTSSMTEAEFLAFLAMLGGTPPEILHNKEMMSLFMPCLRADYGLLDQISRDLSLTAPDLSCPIDMFDGTEDAPHDVEDWKAVTSGPCNIQKHLSGGHFYLKDEHNTSMLMNHIVQHLDETGHFDYM